MMTTRADHDPDCATRLGVGCNCGFAYDQFLARLEPEMNKVLMTVIERLRRVAGVKPPDASHL